MATLHASFVGRRTEIERLTDALVQRQHAKCLELMTVTGDAGVGKSRLAEEFLIGAAAQCPNAITYRGAPIAASAHPYSAVVRMLASRLGIGESDPPAVARHKITVGVIEVMAQAQLSGQAADIVDVFSRLLSCPSESPSPDTPSESSA